MVNWVAVVLALCASGLFLVYDEYIYTYSV